MKKRFNQIGILLLGLSILIGLFAPYNFAQNSENGEAMIVRVKGDVQMLRGSWWKLWNWEPVKPGQELIKGDRVRVGKGGDLEIYFYSESQVRVLENTTVVIGESTMTSYSNGPQRESSIMVKNGEVWVQVEKAVSKVLKFKVETPNAVAGVRGTTFVVKAGLNKTSVMVEEGLVEVQQKKLPNAKVLIAGGNEAKVVGKQKPETATYDDKDREGVRGWSEKAKKDIAKGKPTKEQFIEEPADKDKAKEVKDEEKDKVKGKDGKSDSGRDKNSDEESDKPSGEKDKGNP